MSVVQQCRMATAGATRNDWNQVNDLFPEEVGSDHVYIKNA